MNDSYAYESNNNEMSNIYHYQFSSVTPSCLTLCEPMNRSMPGIPVDHQLPESTQTHVHCVSDTIKQSHPLSSPSPPALNLSQHQFSSVHFSHSVMSESFVTPWTVACQVPLSMGLSQARILEWVAISFSRESSGLRD